MAPQLRICTHCRVSWTGYWGDPCPTCHAEQCQCAQCLAGKPALKTCAVCIKEVPEDRLEFEPIGVNGKNVLVCLACREEHPRQGGYSFESRDVPKACFAHNGHRRRGGRG